MMMPAMVRRRLNSDQEPGSAAGSGAIAPRMKLSTELIAVLIHLSPHPIGPCVIEAYNRVVRL